MPNCVLSYLVHQIAHATFMYYYYGVSAYILVGMASAAVVKERVISDH